MISLSIGEHDLQAGEAFHICYAWAFAPTNEAYRLDNEEPVTIYVNLQDRTDCACCLYTLTINGITMKPTSTFTGVCEWRRFWNIYESGNLYEAVAPTVVWHEYYVEFPNGLDAGTYYVELHAEFPSNIQEVEMPDTIEENMSKLQRTLTDIRRRLLTSVCTHCGSEQFNTTQDGKEICAECGLEKKT